MKFTTVLAAMVAMTGAVQHHHHHGHHHEGRQQQLAATRGRRHHYAHDDMDRHYVTHHRQHMTQNKQRMIPDTLGDKNTETKEKSWSEYEAKRSELHDCGLEEKYNWFGNHRCKEEWECQGARVCEYMNYGAKGVESIGWCRGPTACPFQGPLDKKGKDGKIEYNPGSNRRIDDEEWGERN